jgi:thiosulfate/3-mercaptopyruvate sulfurtransferase
LPDPARLAALFSGWGVTATTLVVAYDNAGGGIAARLWWLLRWMGHRPAALLDGGLPAWQAAGLPLTTEIPEPRQMRFEGSPGWMPTLDVADVERGLAAGELRMIDARTRTRYLGREEPIDPVAGHVPDAVNLPFQEMLTADGAFRPPDSLRAAFEPLLRGRDIRDVAVMCGSGVTACQLIFAMELAGIEGARLYPGSWSEWIRLATRPVARE